MGTDLFTQSGVTSPATRLFAVTPHDTNELTIYTRAIMVTATGNVKVTTVDGDAETLPNLQVGVVYPIRAKIIWSTGTTATGIKGLA